MILPGKHILISESLLALGGLILHRLKSPSQVEELWFWFDQLSKEEVVSKNHSFDHIVLALDFLFAIGLVKIDTKGNIHRAPN
jgi:hypothetical protein